MNFKEGDCEKLNWIELALGGFLVVGSGISESLTLLFVSAMPPGTVKNKYGTVLSFC
jgi:hypothetical protein